MLQFDNNIFPSSEHEYVCIPYSLCLMHGSFATRVLFSVLWAFYTIPLGEINLKPAPFPPFWLLSQHMYLIPNIFLKLALTTIANKLN